MAKYLFYPFADTGDRTPIPEPIQGDGSVSWQQGFTVDYELVYPINPAAKPVPRNQSNQYLYDISNGVKQYQEYGFNDFITNADNQGTDFPYDVFSICRYDSGGGFNLYQSMETANDTLPTDTTKWRLLSGGIIPIAVTDTITDDQINQEFDVDVTSGDVVLTLPAAANWINGDTITFRIVATDVNEDNKMQILGDGAEIISSYNNHDFYFKGSWVTVKKISSGLIISDYYDARSLLAKAFFDVGQSQAIGSSGIVIYPSVEFNFGTFYNVANGQTTLKIPGYYYFNYSIFDNLVQSARPSIKLYVTVSPSPAVAVGNSSSRQDWDSIADPSVGFSANYYTQGVDDIIEVEATDIVSVTSGVRTGLDVILMKRII